MNSQSKLPSRSWTAKEEQGGGKWFPITILSLILISGTAVFLYSIWWSKAPQTFAVSIAVQEYDEAILPQPAYPVWKMDPFRSTVGWNLIESGKPSTARAIEDSFDNLSKELAKRKLNAQDTVVVYFRAHAISHGGKAFVISGDFDQQAFLSYSEKTNEPLAGAVSLDDILVKLQRLKAGNVVLLADICDLSAVPQLGIFDNRIPELIEKSLATMKSGTPLWVLTSAASLQPAHASDLRRRTLMQSACEYACNLRHVESGNNFLSLTKFYDLVLRYCHKVTGGKQTPLLLRNGASVALKDPEVGDWQKHWTKAKSVSLARGPKVPLKKLGEVQSATPATASSESKPKAQESSKVADANTSKEETKVEVEESSPWLRFWQLRDQIQSRTETNGISPVDFAAAPWCRAVNDAVKLERLDRIQANGPSILETDIRKLVGEFTALKDALAKKSKIEDRSRFAAWRTTIEQLTPESGKRPWLFPEDLPNDKQWKEVSNQYRTYFDAMGNLSLWLLSAVNERAEQRSEVLKTLDDLVILLAEADKELQRSKDSIIDSRLTNVDSIRIQLDRLRKLRDDQCNDIIRMLESRSNTKEQIDWHDEFTLQQLLQDPTISYTCRKQLNSVRKALDGSRLNEPGTDNNEVDLNPSIRDLLSKPDTEDSLAYLKGCIKLYESAFKLALGSEGKELKEGLVKLKSPDTQAQGDPILLWKQSCLFGTLISGQASQRAADNFLVVSKDTAVYVALPPNPIRLQSSNATKVGGIAKFEFTIKKSNGTPVPNCWLQWTLVEKKELKGRRDELLRVKLPTGTYLEEGQRAKTPVNPGGRVALMFESSLTQNQLSSFDISVSISEDDYPTKQSQQHNIQVVLPNPNQIDLYAKCLNPGVDNPIIPAKTSEFGPVLSELVVPAAGNDKKSAKSRYELYLWNRSDEPKSVIASLYAAVAPSSRNGNGSISIKTAKRTRDGLEQASLKPAFSTKSPVTLPKNDLLAFNSKAPPGVRIDLSPVADNSPTFKDGEFGLVLVVDEVLLGENNAVTPIGKRSEYWIECRPQNPSGTLVDIRPDNVVDSFKFNISVPKKQLWATWDLDKLPVQATLTDSNGNEIPSLGGEKLDLDAEKSEVSMQIKPQVPITDNSRLFAHIDIGGYPRAITYASRLTGDNDETKPATQTFVGIKRDEIEFLDKADKPITAEQTDVTDAITVPARENSDDKILGKEIAVQKVAVPFFVDCRTKKKITLSLGESSAIEFDYDRKFKPTFEIVGGVLTFSAKMQDLSGEFKLNSKLSSHVNLTVVVTDENLSGSQEESASVDLLFDRKPPQRGDIACDRYDVYADDDSVEFSIALSNEMESSVKKVYFAIDRKQGRVDRFDESDLLHLEAELSSDGIWFHRVKVETLAKTLQRSDSYSVVCRAIDEAGNVQDENKPAEFRWTNDKRPKNKPAPPPKPKKNPATPPAKPALHNVTVDVTLKGKQLPEGKLEVKGIPGATQAQKGGRKVYTKVPDGNYEVSASFTDQSGGKFEGAATLSLSAESASQVSIDLKQVK